MPTGSDLKHKKNKWNEITLTIIYIYVVIFSKIFKYKIKQADMKYYKSNFRGFFTTNFRRFFIQSIILPRLKI